MHVMEKMMATVRLVDGVGFVAAGSGAQGTSFVWDWRPSRGRNVRARWNYRWRILGQILLIQLCGHGRCLPADKSTRILVKKMPSWRDPTWQAH